MPAVEPREFSRHLWRAILSPLVLLAAHAAIITVLFLFLLSASEASKQSDEVVRLLGEFERLLVNMETGRRGYMLTGEQEFFLPNARSRPRLRPTLADLKELVDDEPTQLELINRLEQSVNEWLSTEEQMPQAGVIAGLPPETRNLMVERKELMDAAREKLRQIWMHESNLRSQRYDREKWASTLALLGGVGVTMILAVMLALINRRTVLAMSKTYESAILDQAAAGQQFADLTESIPQLIWITDAAGQGAYFNHSWTEFTGLDKPGLLERGWVSVVHPEDAPAAVDRWTRSLTTLSPFEAEYRLRHGPDGSYRWFLCRAIPVKDRTGTRIRWFGSCTDIEHQKQIAKDRERALAAERAARSDLLRQSRTKDEFLATLSHELRTPMTAILGWARLLQDPKVRNNSLERAIDAIEKNSRSQARLIEDLLDMSRINAGKLVLNFEHTALVPLVKAAIESVAPAASNKQITITLDAGENEDLSLDADPSRLQQIVGNLLSNAVKFTFQGGQVTVKIDRVGDSAQIAVRDDGQGIDPVFLPHIFERFRQADGSTTRRHGGLGLGLAIVKHLVEMHGGRVSASSDGLGKGAEFQVQLPLKGTTIHQASDPDNSMALPSLDGTFALIVDDDPDAAGVEEAILQSAGCRTATTHSAREAMDFLKRFKVDLIVSDVGMPEMDGYALLKAIRSDESTSKNRMTPAIALTALARAEDKRNAADAGFNAHLAKPVLPEDLIATAYKVRFGDVLAARGNGQRTSGSRGDI